MARWRDQRFKCGKCDREEIHLARIDGPMEQFRCIKCSEKLRHLGDINQRTEHPFHIPQTGVGRLFIRNNGVVTGEIDIQHKDDGKPAKIRDVNYVRK